MVRYNKFVVKSQHDVSQFSELWIAEKHAQLNSPASIFRGEQVSRIEGKYLHLHANDCEPIARY